MANLQFVGSVVDIDGPRLMYRRPAREQSGGGWFQAYEGMKVYIGDEFRTDRNTQAVLEFIVGGRAGIPKMRYQPMKKANSNPSIYPNRKSPIYPGGASRAAYVKVVSPNDITLFDPHGKYIFSAKFWSKFEKPEVIYELGRGGIEG